MTKTAQHAAMELGDSKIESSSCRAAQEQGYPAMKPEQREVVAGILRGRDVFAVLLTGFNKSLCFACLPAAFDQLHPYDEPTIVVVIAPLTAIMKDQVNKTTIRWTMQLLAVMTFCASMLVYNKRYRQTYGVCLRESESSCLQVASLSVKGLRACYIAGDTEDDVKEGVIRGDYQIVFFTPEMLLEKK